MFAYLFLAVLGTVALVVSLVIQMLWRARTSPGEGHTAEVAGGLLAVWAVALVALGVLGAFVPRAGQRVPPVAIALAVALVVWWASLAAFPSLWRLLSRNQPTLIRMHLWRFLGPAVFLVLLAAGKLPGLFAWP